MATDAYRERLRGLGVSETDINERVQTAEALEAWLRERGLDLAAAEKADLERYAKRMIAQGSNTIQNFDTLSEYALWSGLRAQYIALVEITDCYQGIEKLMETVERQHGAAVRNQIFDQPPPPLGADERERFTYTRQIAERMADILTPEEARAAWFQVKHGIPEAYWQKQDAAEREKFAGCGSIEAFIRQKKQARGEMLTALHAQNKLWFTMELTDEVLAFLLDDRHMQVGEHNGRRGIVITKVPYQADRYLRETDDRLKRYYACHCPLIRDAILTGEPIPAEVCACSLGHASHFLAGLGLPLTGEVLTSAAQGDDRCRFIFYLPDAYADV